MSQGLETRWGVTGEFYMGTFNLGGDYSDALFHLVLTGLMGGIYKLSGWVAGGQHQAGFSSQHDVVVVLHEDQKTV